MPAFTPPLPGYGYQGSAAGAGAEPLQHYSSSGSTGTFFGVLAAILVLTLLSCLFGRVCTGQAEGPDERYDCTRLAQRWCGGWRAPRRAVVKREAKAPPVAVVEVAAALPPPEEP
ncbi:hypothetical protein BAE44_0025146 [Dichanthelium oligosanthes]|uniref:Uncharacterized protein n=1 Tax=Dichanthelium oligosanthes TaxID=888268 RepID=A0A1E5ULT3_9POAL|nr:hypothetical protein BAE44_0025146 [Dichanthelium oligosanthes]